MSRKSNGETKNNKSSGPSQRVINKMSRNKKRSIQDFGDSPSMHQRIAAREAGIHECTGDNRNENCVGKTRGQKRSSPQ